MNLKLTIKRSPENGGNLIVKNYQELESSFLSLNLHPADLKAFLVEQLDAFYFEPIRNNKKIMLQLEEQIECYKTRVFLISKKFLSILISDKYTPKINFLFFQTLILFNCF
uniref:Uncharacterized protein n=1 Tax=Meloidogyne enterolobii TaxID=390850 RepID=A0A6V7UG01_MELEN|nr:unnamed protein product [Meloidogyne enterolobii]